jgi:uncharacterized protein YfaS (alpha-2-macroglobulin family)
MVNEKNPSCNKTCFLYPQDPQGNHIQQWVNETSAGGILSLSFQLFSESIGWYRIIVKTASEKEKYHSFSVEEYGKH